MNNKTIQNVLPQLTVDAAVICSSKAALNNTQLFKNCKDE